MTFTLLPDCLNWQHGAVFINNFNIGRYHTVGPQKTLYIPGPFLKKGQNEVSRLLSCANLKHGHSNVTSGFEIDLQSDAHDIGRVINPL